jgi:hypothetical protein
MRRRTSAFPGRWPPLGMPQLSSGHKAMILGLLLKDAVGQPCCFPGEPLAVPFPQLVLLEKSLAFRRVEAAADEPLAVSSRTSSRRP